MKNYDIIEQYGQYREYWLYLVKTFPVNFYRICSFQVSNNCEYSLHCGHKF